jgi:primosomal protein N' (replication factor Y)
MKAMQETARYHAATTGAVLFSYLPKSLRALPDMPTRVGSERRPRLRGFIVPRIYQDLTRGRIDFYRTAIREAFAAGGSAFIVVPTVADAERVYNELISGIEQYAFLLHSSLPQKTQSNRIAEIIACDHPVFIVATPSYLAVPRTDLATIMVERESSSLYRGRTRPFVDARVVIHAFASALGGQLYLADLPVRIDSIHRRQKGDYDEVVTGAHRMKFASEAHISNMQGVATSPKTTFQALSKELVERITSLEATGGQTVLYVARKGLSPVTLCRDCGTVVTCKDCGASVVLHRGSEENYFLCHSCGSMRHARERCGHCKSWRLEAFGIGTELVERELASLFPHRKVFVLSGDTAKTHAQAKKIRDAFYETPGSILVGTEFIIPYLSEEVPLVGIVSLDSLLSLASWNVYERIASMLTRLRECARDTYIVQTRRPETPLLTQILSGNFSGFYKSELATRASLGYPPYTVIIKISVTGSQKEIESLMGYASETLKPYELITFSRMLKAPGGKFSLHGFVRVDKATWSDETLVSKLLSLPPSYTIIVDPESVL